MFSTHPIWKIIRENPKTSAAVFIAFAIVIVFVVMRLDALSSLLDLVRN